MKEIQHRKVKSKRWKTTKNQTKPNKKPPCKARNNFVSSIVAQIRRPVLGFPNVRIHTELLPCNICRLDPVCSFKRRQKFLAAQLIGHERRRRVVVVTWCFTPSQEEEEEEIKLQSNQSWPALKQKRHQKCRSSTVRGVHATLIVGSPSFVKESVLCRLPNQRERLKHAFFGSKPADVPRASPVSAKLCLFNHSKRSGLCTRKERLS